MLRNELDNGAPENPTERTRRRWDRMARDYDRRGDRAEQWLIGDARAWLCGQATGRTLEIAVGTGRNLGFYRDAVALTGLDLSTEMLAVARRRTTELGLRVDLWEGDSQALPFADGDFDTVVCTLALCTIPDQRTAVAEMRRVLRPEGRLLLMDHVEYTRVPLRWVERLRAWPRSRPLNLVRQHGFAVERHDRLALGLVDHVGRGGGEPAATHARDPGVSRATRGVRSPMANHFYLVVIWNLLLASRSRVQTQRPRHSGARHDPLQEQPP